MGTRRALVSLLLPVLASAALAVPVAAEDLTPPTTAQPSPETPDAGIGIESIGDCTGCYAEWGLWDLGSNVRAKRASYTGEVVDVIHVHWAVIKPATDSCGADWHDGEYATYGTKEAYNSIQDQIFDEQFSQGWQNAWGNAGAHFWVDDGWRWPIGSNGETDICKVF